MKPISSQVKACVVLAGWCCAAVSAQEPKGRAASAEEIAAVKHALAASLGAMRHARVSYRQRLAGEHWSEEIDGTFQIAGSRQWSRTDKRTVFEPGYQLLKGAVDGSFAAETMKERVERDSSSELLWDDGRRWNIRRESGRIVGLDKATVPVPNLLAAGRDVRALFGLIAYPQGAGEDVSSSVADVIAEQQSATVAEGTVTFSVPRRLRNGNECVYRVSILNDGSGCVASQAFSIPKAKGVLRLTATSFGEAQGLKYPAAGRLTHTRGGRDVSDDPEAFRVTSLSLTDLEAFPDTTSLSTDRSVTFQDLDAGTTRRSDTDSIVFAEGMKEQAATARRIVDEVMSAPPRAATVDASQSPHSNWIRLGLVAVALVVGLLATGIHFHRKR